jgi:protein-arginine kinase activator protein McsA
MYMYKNYVEADNFGKQNCYDTGTKQTSSKGYQAGEGPQGKAHEGNGPAHQGRGSHARYLQLTVLLARINHDCNR